MNAKNYLELHLIVFLWGFTAVLGVLITIPAVELVLLRTLGSAVLILLFLKILGKPVLVERNDVFKLLGTGLIFSVHWILFFGSAKVSNVSVLLVGMSTITLWTALINPMLKGGRIKKLEIVLGLIIVAGAYIVFRADFSYVQGFLMAIGSAVCAAIFTILNSGFARRINHFQVMGYEMLGAFIGTLIFIPLYANIKELNFELTNMDWIYLAILILVCTLYAYSASVRLMKSITPFVVNLTINLEPVYGIVLALIQFGDSEKMNREFYLGSSIILAAVIAYPIVKKLNKNMA